MEDLRKKLEARRRERLASLGVAEDALEASELPPSAEPQGGSLRLMQFNILAEALSNDGFLTRPVLKDWPTDRSSVPTSSSGDSVSFTQMLEEMMAAKGKEPELKALKAKFGTSVAKQNLTALVDPEARRLQILLLVIHLGCPDVIVMEEVDSFAALSEGLAELGYASQLPDRMGSYMPSHCRGHGLAEDGEASKDAFLRDWYEQGHTFLPKLGSTSMSMRIREAGLGNSLLKAAEDLGKTADIADLDSGTAKLKKKPFLGLSGGSGALLRMAGLEKPESWDDDGIAIFWRKDKLAAVGMQAYVSSSGLPALLVRFQDLSTKHSFKVLGTHLGSGSAPADEDDRLKKQLRPDDGLLSWIRGLQQDMSGPLFLFLDANAHPQLRPTEGEANVWQSLRDRLGASVWDDYFDETGAEKARTEAVDAPVTTNKLRGFDSDQVKKIGSHAYHLIDHLFYDPKVYKFERHAFGPKQYPSKKKAMEDLLPTLSMPSDHFPLVADFQRR